MSKKNQHVIPFGAGWAVLVEGRKSVSVITHRQSDAIGYARDIAKKEKAELIIHGRNGQIRGRSSYKPS